MGVQLPADLADALTQAAPRLPRHLDVRHFADVDSTNEIALKLAAAGAGEATVVIADAQHAGRGRRGRVWFSPPGAGLYLSCIVDPRSPGPLERFPFMWRPASAGPSAGPPEGGHHTGPGLQPLLTLAAGVATARAVAAVAALPVELKWPNDVVIGRPWRKLAGILCESIAVGAGMDAVVVGIGINLQPAAYPADLARTATSIEVELGRPMDRAPLVVACIAELFAAVGRLRRGEAPALLDEWRRLGRGGLENVAVRWHDQDGERRGRARDIASDGALLVDAGGVTERIVSGEVTWETTI